MPASEAGTRGHEASLQQCVSQGGQYSLPVRERLSGDIPGCRSVEVRLPPSNSIFYTVVYCAM